jgi:hypothetical protein
MMMTMRLGTSFRRLIVSRSSVRHVCMYVCMRMYIHPSIYLCVCVRARGEPVRVHGDGQHACMQAAPCAVGWGHVPLSDVVCLAQVSERERRTHTHTQVRDRET